MRKHFARLAHPRLLEFSEGGYAPPPSRALWIKMSGMSLALGTNSVVSIGYFLLLTLIAGLSYTQAPLYSSNQNQYFLHGLAHFVGHLADDWLANTADPTPVFSLLVTLTYRYFGEHAFYLYHMLVCGVYFYGLLGIIASTFNNGASKGKQVVYVAIVIFLHSALLGYLSSTVLRVDLRWLATNGLAGQYILGATFQPSMFGAFLVLSIFAFLRGRAFLAVFLAAVAATVHPTYLVAAGVLVLSFALMAVRENRGIREASLIILTGVVLMLPIAMYVYLAFKPSSPSAWAAAQDILINVRLPHHFLIRRWLVRAAALQIAIVLSGIYLLKKTRLYTILLFSALVAGSLTSAQVLLHSTSLALLLPWRLSVYLVPISSSVIAAYLVARVLDLKAENPLKEKIFVSLGWLLILISFLAGILLMKRDFADSQSEAGVQMMQFVRSTRTAGSVYLIPNDLERFRLYTGVPVFVDHKSIPYGDVELVEWYTRFRVARDFYGLDQPAMCAAAARLSATYALTHVVLHSDQAGDGCGSLRRLYEDNSYSVFKFVRQ